MAKIKVHYFSPTGGTLQVVRLLAEALDRMLHVGVEYHSYTLPTGREVLPVFDAGDIVLWATPVYAGRIPNKTLDYVRAAIHANGNPSIALVTFGNRAYDNALAELVGLMKEGSMKPVERLSTFNAQLLTVSVPGEAHPEKYYTPLKVGNAPAGFLKAKPSCNSALCTRCGECMDVCPMGSIGEKDGMPTFDGICIKCQACRRLCPTGAIAFTDPEYLAHVAMIERTFAAPKRAEFYVAGTTHSR